MQISINKDFEREYPDDTWKGFTMKQVLCILVAVTFMGLLILALFILTDWYIANIIYIGIIPFAIILGFGFYKYQNRLSVYDVLKLAVYLNKTNTLLFEANEYDRSTQRIFTMKRADYQHNLLVNRKKKGKIK